MYRRQFLKEEGFTLSVKANTSHGSYVLSGDGHGIEGRAGAGLLTAVADRIGLTKTLQDAVDGCRSWRDHPPGRVLRDLAVMLADGGTTISGIEAVRRGNPVLFGPVASEPTAWRTIQALAADESDIDLLAALGVARIQAWAAGAAPADWDDITVPATIDIDATLITAHSDKDQAAGNYKGGFGYHPLLGWLDRGDGHGEPLGAILRPGNAGANHAGDNIDVLNQCLANLPATPAGKQIIVRGDSAMATKDVVGYARQAGVAVSMSLPIGRQPRVQQAIRALHTDQPDVWQPAIRQDRSIREGAHVAELCDPPLAEGWPTGMRIIVRREPLHPGAQQTLDDIDGHRFTATLTDVTTTDIIEIDRHHRARARIEDRIKDAKDCGLANLPCDDFDRNAIWMLTVLISLTLTSWTQLLCLDGDLRIARLPTLRYRLFHTAARIITRSRQTFVRLQADWPWTRQLIDAFDRLAQLPAPAT